MNLQRLEDDELMKAMVFIAVVPVTRMEMISVGLWVWDGVSYFR